MLNSGRTTWRALWLVPLLLPLGACAGEYPSMIRARDQTIRDLETRLSATQRENEDLRRRNGELSSENDDLRNRKPEVVTIPASSPGDDELDRIRKELPKDVLVRWRNRGLSIGIPNAVTFAPGQAKISSEGQAVLARVASVVRKRYSEKLLYIEGHTDTDPIRKSKDRFRSNRHLSVERADAVARFLETTGKIAEKRIVIAGFGPWDPAVPGEKSANRRVEIVVADK